MLMYMALLMSSILARPNLLMSTALMAASGISLWRPLLMMSTMLSPGSDMAPIACSDTRGLSSSKVLASGALMELG